MSAIIETAMPNNKTSSSDGFEENPRVKEVMRETRPTFEELKKIEKHRRDILLRVSLLLLLLLVNMM